MRLTTIAAASLGLASSVNAISFGIPNFFGSRPLTPDGIENSGKGGPENEAKPDEAPKVPSGQGIFVPGSRFGPLQPHYELKHKPEPEKDSGKKEEFEQRPGKIARPFGQKPKPASPDGEIVKAGSGWIPITIPHYPLKEGNNKQQQQQQKQQKPAVKEEVKEEEHQPQGHGTETPTRITVYQRPSHNKNKDNEWHYHSPGQNVPFLDPVSHGRVRQGPQHATHNSLPVRAALPWVHDAGNSTPSHDERPSPKRPSLKKPEQDDKADEDRPEPKHPKHKRPHIERPPSRGKMMDFPRWGRAVEPTQEHPRADHPQEKRPQQQYPQHGGQEPGTVHVVQIPHDIPQSKGAHQEHDHALPDNVHYIYPQWHHQEEKRPDGQHHPQPKKPQQDCPCEDQSKHQHPQQGRPEQHHPQQGDQKPGTIHLVQTPQPPQEKRPQPEHPQAGNVRLVPHPPKYPQPGHTRPGHTRPGYPPPHPPHAGHYQPGHPSGQPVHVVYLPQDYHQRRPEQQHPHPERPQPKRPQEDDHDQVQPPPSRLPAKNQKQEHPPQKKQKPHPKEDYPKEDHHEEDDQEDDHDQEQNEAQRQYPDRIFSKFRHTASEPPESHPDPNNPAIKEEEEEASDSEQDGGDEGDGETEEVTFTRTRDDVFELEKAMRERKEEKDEAERRAFEDFKENNKSDILSRRSDNTSSSNKASSLHKRQDWDAQNILRNRICIQDKNCKRSEVCAFLWKERGVGLCVSKKDKAMLETIQREAISDEKKNDQPPVQQVAYPYPPYPPPYHPGPSVNVHPGYYPPHPPQFPSQPPPPAVPNNAVLSDAEKEEIREDAAKTAALAAAEVLEKYQEDNGKRRKKKGGDKWEKKQSIKIKTKEKGKDYKNQKKDRDESTEVYEDAEVVTDEYPGGEEHFEVDDSTEVIIEEQPEVEEEQPEVEEGQPEVEEEQPEAEQSQPEQSHPKDTSASIEALPTAKPDAVVPEVGQAQEIQVPKTNVSSALPPEGVVPQVAPAQPTQEVPQAAGLFTPTPQPTEQNLADGTPVKKTWKRDGKEYCGGGSKSESVYGRYPNLE